MSNNSRLGTLSALLLAASLTVSDSSPISPSADYQNGGISIRQDSTNQSGKSGDEPNQDLHAVILKNIESREKSGDFRFDRGLLTAFLDDLVEQSTDNLAFIPGKQEQIVNYVASMQLGGWNKENYVQFKKTIESAIAASPIPKNVLARNVFINFDSRLIYVSRSNKSIKANSSWAININYTRTLPNIT